MYLICAGDIPGKADIIKPAVPATIGAAYDVPLPNKYHPGAAVIGTLYPGAVKSTDELYWCGIPPFGLS